MTDWLRALELSAPVQALKSSYVAYPVINGMHILAVGFLLTCVILMDLRLLGAFRDLPEKPFVRLFRKLALGAFAAAVLTGLTMFSIRANDYAAMPLFFAKMGLILAAGLNFLIFTSIDRNRSHGTAPSPGARLCATLSIPLWLAVLLAGRFLGFVQ